MFLPRLTLVVGVLVSFLAISSRVEAQPTLKGALEGLLMYGPSETGLADFAGTGRLTLMGKVIVYGEFEFVPGDEGSLHGLGVMIFQAVNGDQLVSNVVWEIDAERDGRLEFRWPGVITLASGKTVHSTGRFVELPFGGLRGTSTLTSPSVTDPNIDLARIRMTGEIVDPDPLD